MNIRRVLGVLLVVLLSLAPTSVSADALNTIVGIGMIGGAAAAAGGIAWYYLDPDTQQRPSDDELSPSQTLILGGLITFGISALFSVAISGGAKEFIDGMEQIEQYRLPTKPRKASEKRRPDIEQTVEAEALPAGTMRALLRDAVDGYLDPGIRQRLRVSERAQRESLLTLWGSAP